MTSVFIGGSRKISKLNKEIKRRIDNIIESQYTILIGDANGADKAVQNYLSQSNYEKVLVFCVANNCRNNIGNWEIKSIMPKQDVKDFHYYSTKDIEMVNYADYGFMIWDGKSKGTLRNIMDLLKSNKQILLYFAPEKNFYQIVKVPDLERILTKHDKKSTEKLRKEADLAQIFNVHDNYQTLITRKAGTGSFQLSLDNLVQTSERILKRDSDPKIRADSGATTQEREK